MASKEAHLYKIGSTVNVDVDIQQYSQEEGLSLSYEDGCKIEVSTKDGGIVVAANCAGLLTLARALLTLAQADVPLGQYLDYDEWSGLEPGSRRIYFIKSATLSSPEP